MKRTIAVKCDEVFSGSRDMIAGIKRYGNGLGVVLITESVLRNSIITAEAAVRGYDEAVVAKVMAVAAQSEADEQGKQFIRAARSLIALKYGEYYSPMWGPTGFPNNSTSMPGTMAARQTLLRALQNFFANHATMENALLNVTAEEAGIRFNALSDKRSAVNNAYDLMKAALVNRDAAIADLRRKMRGCIDELSQLMSDTDSRWYSFGLTPPAAPETPEIVDSVVLNQAGPGLVLAQWGGAPRAGRYRVLKQIVGVDVEPVPFDTVYDTQIAFTSLVAGQTLRVQVEAVNDAGVAVPSDVVEIVVT